MVTDDHRLGERITMEVLAGERLRARVTQRQLASALGIGRMRLSYLETSTMVVPTAAFVEEWMHQLRQPMHERADD